MTSLNLTGRALLRRRRRPAGTIGNIASATFAPERNSHGATADMARWDSRGAAGRAEQVPLNVPRETAAELIQERLEQVSTRLRITDASARRYLTDDAVLDLARRSPSAWRRRRRARTCWPRTETCRWSTLPRLRQVSPRWPSSRSVRRAAAHWSRMLPKPTGYSSSLIVRRGRTTSSPNDGAPCMAVPPAQEDVPWAYDCSRGTRSSPPASARPERRSQHRRRANMIVTTQRAERAHCRESGVPNLC
jgi:hypothetical protein